MTVNSRMDTSELVQRLRYLAETLDGDYREHPITAREDCLLAAEQLEAFANGTTLVLREREGTDSLPTQSSEAGTLPARGPVQIPDAGPRFP